MTEQLHPDLHRLQQQYLQLVQAVNDQTMSVDQAMATLQALKVIDGAGYEWAYTPAGQLTRAVPGQGGQPAEPWEFTTPQLPPHASDPGLAQMGGGTPFPPPYPDHSGSYPPQQAPGYPPQQAPGYSQLGGPPTRSLPSSLPNGQGKAHSALVGRLTGLLRLHGKLIGVGAACVMLLVVGLGQLRGVDSGPTVADAVPVNPPAPVEIPVIPAPVPAPQPEGGTGSEPEQETAPELAAPDGDRVIAVLTALRSAQVELLEDTVVTAGSRLSSRLLAAQLSGFPAVGLELVADPAAPSGEGLATQTWRVVELNTGETLNSVTVDWVLRDGRWLVSTVPPLG